jgi:ABC-type branched-subunit amino acid transport system substrate-binding protein
MGFHSRGARIIGLFATATAVLAGILGPSSSTWAATSSPGVTQSSIRIAQIADVSGPIPGLMQGTVFGTEAWAAYVNSTGGINGRKIVIDREDSQLSCTIYTNEIQAAAKADFAMVGSASAADSCGVQTLKANPSFPDLPALLVSTAYQSLPNVYVPSPQPPGWRDESYLWVKQKYGSAVVQKFAALYATVDQAGFNAQANAAKTAGYKLIYSRGVGYTESNFSSDILRMKAEGVKVVDTQSLSIPQTADFLQQAAQQNFHPDAVISFAYDNTLLKLVGNPSYASNVVVGLPFAMFLGKGAKTVPSVATMYKWLQKTNPGAPMTIFVVESWLAGTLFQQALQKLGSNPTQTGLLSAVKGINSFTANSLIPKQQTGRKIPSPCVLIAGVKNGQFVRIDPAKSGYICSGKYVLYSGS